MKTQLQALGWSAISALVLEFFGLWWAMPVAGFLGGRKLRQGGAGFLWGGLGAALAWLVYILVFLIIAPTGKLLAVLAGILGLGTDLAVVPAILALVLAFLLGGLGGLTGGWYMQSK